MDQPRDLRIRINLAGAAAVFALLLGGAAVWVAVIARDASTARLRAERTVTVKGSARERVVSDRAQWQIQVVGTGATLAAAYTPLDDALGRVRDFLGAQGFPAEAMALGAIGTTELRTRTDKGYETNAVEGYRLERWIAVGSADVERVATASGRITELLREGHQVVSRPPRFLFTQASEAKARIIGLATADARRRGEEIARQAGGRLGPVTGVASGPLQITEPDGEAGGGYGGTYDTDTIPKDLSVVVTATFEILPE